MVKKQFFNLFYIFCSFTLLVCAEKNILPIVRSRSRFFGSLEPEPLEKIQGVGAGGAWEKDQEPEPEPLKKKVRSRSR